jgi:glycosyltransferase involved in cell wall biosynthesis
MEEIIDKTKEFSVILSLYNKEKPEYFNMAMKSIWDYQILKPSEIILVLDGELTEQLEKTIQFWSVNIGENLKIVRLENNVGLAMALNDGLKVCECDLIARMDTDDISMPERFLHQVNFMLENPEIDVVGSYITEIDENNNIVKELLKVPLSHDDILQVFKKRNVMIHPTVMFRKSFFKKAGNYTNDLLLAEDYYLWYKGFLNKCIFANIPEIGLKFRRTNDFYKRRSGFKKLIGLLKFRIFTCNRDLKFGLISDIYAIFYFCIQISPVFVKKLAYGKLR